MALAKKIKIGKNEPLLDPFFFILLKNRQFSCSEKCRKGLYKLSWSRYKKHRLSTKICGLHKMVMVIKPSTHRAVRSGEVKAQATTSSKQSKPSRIVEIYTHKEQDSCKCSMFITIKVQSTHSHQQTPSVAMTSSLRAWTRARRPS